jgi:hypothetical protein
LWAPTPQRPRRLGGFVDDLVDPLVALFSQGEWEALLAGDRHGEFDAPARAAQPRQ